MAYRGTGLTPFFGSGFPLFPSQRELDRLFGDAGFGSGGRWMPAVDIREDDKQLALDIELPGIKPENVNISVDNGVLSVSGEKRAERRGGQEATSGKGMQENEEESGRYHTIERSYGSFFRSFQLPQGVDESQITADFNNGLLTINIPKTALPQPRKIQIGSGKEREVTGQAAREPVSSRSSSTTSGTSSERKQSGDRMAASGSEHRESEGSRNR